LNNLLRLARRLINSYEPWQAYLLQHPECRKGRAKPPPGPYKSD
jgi:hypothetical protein